MARAGVFQGRSRAAAEISDGGKLRPLGALAQGHPIKASGDSAVRYELVTARPFTLPGASGTPPGATIW